MSVNCEEIKVNFTESPLFPTELGDPEYLQKVQKVWEWCQKHQVEINSFVEVMNRNNVKLNEVVSLLGNQNATYRGAYDADTTYAFADTVSLEIGNIQQMFFSIENNNNDRPPSSKWICTTNYSVVVQTPTITGTAKVASTIESSFSFSAVALLEQLSIDNYEIDWGDGTGETISSNSATHTYIAELGTIFVIRVIAIDSLGNRSNPAVHSVEVVDMYIDIPTDIIVEGSPDEVPENAEVQLTELPNAIGTTIDKIYFRVIKVSDSSQVGSTLETTDLTLPITFDTPDGLEVSTQYRFEFQCVSEADNIQSTWGNIEATTEESFIPIVDPFKDGGGVALYLFDGNINDEGGIYNGTFYHDSYSTACGNKSILKDQAYDRESACFLYDGGQMPGFSDSDTFTVSFFAKIKNPPNNGNSYTILTTTTGYNQGNNGNRKRYITFGDDREIGYRETPDDGATETKSVSFGVNAEDTCHHFAVTKSGSEVKTYVDGVLKNTSNDFYTNHYDNLNTVRLLTPAGSSHNNDLGANGHVSIIHFFNRVLTENEINKLRKESYS